VSVDIWEQCRGRTHFKPLAYAAIRMVESQEYVATTSLVDNLDEQGILETLLEQTKPPTSTVDRRYLLAAPFRYPPLKYGSRFGGYFEPSLFYASLNITTVLAETAYYRLVFLDGMSTPWKNPLITEHTAFRINIKTDRGVRLQAPPFNKYAEQLTSPSSYTTTQSLGSEMRDAGVEAFQFISARDLEAGVNTGVFVPSAIISRKPRDLQQWICHTTSERVGFRAVKTNETPYHFRRSQFCVNKQLPQPAL